MAIIVMPYTGLPDFQDIALDTLKDQYVRGELDLLLYEDTVDRALRDDNYVLSLVLPGSMGMACSGELR